MKTTNYTNTFIAVADDCPVNKAEVPPVKGFDKTVANIEYDMLADHPYKFTSDDVLFKVYAIKHGLSDEGINKEREKFFSKSQACLRASPLAKRYGWGIASNEHQKVAIFPVESDAYKKLLADDSKTQLKAMRSKKES